MTRGVRSGRGVGTRVLGPDSRPAFKAAERTSSGGGGSGERLSLTVRDGADSVVRVEAVTNIEENIGKTVGRRRIQDSLEFGFGLQRTLAQIQEGSALRSVPKGVFKFRSFQEADAWMMHHLTAPRS